MLKSMMLHEGQGKMLYLLEFGIYSPIMLGMYYKYSTLHSHFIDEQSSRHQFHRYQASNSKVVIPPKMNVGQPSRIHRSEKKDS